MTFTNRKLVRQELATLLTNTSAYQAVYAYPKEDLRNQSPVCVLESAGTERNIDTADYDDSNFYITVVHLVRRDNTETAQDTLDDLELNLIQTIKTNYAEAQWTLAEYDDVSSVKWTTLGQVPYIAEVFRIRILHI